MHAMRSVAVLAPAPRGPWKAAEPYLRLMRPANMITALADVMAGYAVAGLPGYAILGALLPASLGLYGGGVVLNDFFDRRLDAEERPERPIPSGLVSPNRAALLGALLLCAGVAAAFAAGWRAGAVATLLAGCALVYDAWAKHSAWLGPLTMGACRGLNFLLGLAAAGGPRTAWLAALLPLAYVAAITLISAGEVSGGRRPRIPLAIALFGAVLLALAAIGAARGRLLWLAPFWLLLALRLAPPLARALRMSSPALIRAAVAAAVLSLIVLESAVASVYAGPLYAGLVLCLMLGAAPLRRLFPVE